MAIATINTRDVQVIAVQFSKNSPQARFESFPRRIVYGGREYILADAKKGHGSNNSN